MRAWVSIALLLLASVSARAEGIVNVLQRSQALRLQALPAAAEGPRADSVRRSFEQLRQLLQNQPPIELRVIKGPVVAETLLGTVIVANEGLADLPEGERLFILAHELGHVVAGHWRKVERLYQHWIPGDVTPAATEPVAVSLGRDASGLSYQQEFEADAFALQTLRVLSRPTADAFAAFQRIGLQRDTVTHPGTRKRVAALRQAVSADGAAQSGSDAE